MTIRTLSILFASLYLAACGQTEIIDTTAGKGEESPLPENAKDDSFRKPTEHGALTFGIQAQGTITEDEGYHVWDFTLTGHADITLQTDLITDNLDTVLYVYSREPGAEKWGHYKKRNDDFEKNVWSRVEFTGEAAEYRVLVKAFKRGLRGTFGLTSTCDGAGCPQTGAADEHSMPAGGDLNADCMGRLQTVLDSDVMGGDGFSITYETERLALTGTALKAVDFYKEYWQDIGFWEDMTFGDDVHGLNVDSILMEDGSLVSVDNGGDEDTLTFVFDGGGELLAYYHSEQSPTIAFFCKDNGSDSVEEPEEFCFGAWLNFGPKHMDNAGDLESGTATVKEVSDSDELDPLVGNAIMHYANDALVDEETEISFSGMRWESSDFGFGARITLEADGHKTLTYETGGSDFGDGWVLFVTDDHGTTRFICDEF